MTGVSKLGLQSHVAFSPDSKLLACVGMDKRIHLWDVATRAERARVHAEQGVLHCVAFAPNGKSLATASEGGVKLWDVRLLQDRVVLRERAALTGFGCAIYGLAFLPDGKLLAFGVENKVEDGEVRLCDAVTGKELATLHSHDDAVHCVAFSPDGKSLASGSVDQTVKLWNTDKALRQQRRK